ncbi:MAG: homing endonuclease associated repeat-containing protein [Patescibacteria group bacterium]
MKFHLTEPNKQFSNVELIEDLKQTASALGKTNVSQREYKKYGKFSYQTQKKRFGSWENALKEAGLQQSKRSWGGDLLETRIPEDQLISNMQSVAKKLDKQNITIMEYDENGKFGSSAICKRFGGWNNAKEKAKLKINRLYNTPEEDYFKNIAESLGAIRKTTKISRNDSSVV